MSEKPLILRILPALLGFVSLVVPNLGFKYEGFGLWFFGIYEFGEDFDLFDYSKAVDLIGVPIGVVILCAGSLVALLAALNVVKLGKLSWLPGVIMIAGAITALVPFGVAYGGELLEAAPIVVGTACALVGGVWSLVIGLKLAR